MMKREKRMREGNRKLYVVDRTGPRFRQEKGEKRGVESLNLLKGMYVMEIGPL